MILNASQNLAMPFYNFIRKKLLCMIVGGFCKILTFNILKLNFS